MELLNPKRQSLYVACRIRLRSPIYQVAIFDADGTFVCYAPADEDWNMDSQMRDKYSESARSPEGVSDEGLYIHGRAREAGGRYERERAPSLERR